MSKLDELLAECERLDKEATKGPWLARRLRHVEYQIEGPPPVEGAANTLIGYYAGTLDDQGPSRNAPFSARARLLLPLLAKIVEALVDASTIEFDARAIAERVIKASQEQAAH